MAAIGVQVSLAGCLNAFIVCCYWHLKELNDDDDDDDDDEVGLCHKYNVNIL